MSDIQDAVALAIDFGSLCQQCLRAPRMKGRTRCEDCKRRYDLDRWHAKQRQLKRDRLNPDACNCGDHNCNGLMCQSIKHGTANEFIRASDSPSL